MTSDLRPLLVASRAGLSRGRIELRQGFTNAETLWGYLLPTVVLLVVMFFARDATVPGTDFSLGGQMLPSSLGMLVAFGGLATVAAIIATEREDGTLLRAKATPNGMLGYLISRIVVVAGMGLVSSALLLVPGSFLLDGLMLGNPVAWLTLAGVLVLGMVATMPIGAVLGSLLSNPREVGLVTLPIMGLVAISGIFYPVTVMPGWVQGLAQVFPVYWLGLGMRSALLPDAMAAVELGGSWRHLETLLVLGGWAVAGLALAPVALRRMARRESGASVAARREKAMQRVTW
ncbi:ABC transporter permease [Micromonospora endophytica]|uniref:ABC transporter n=1 Tax=Micromonospora endophytica TaxID=515350 RepID=A0A2W2D7R0_9ACTN|nr:ABC transporter permease [Micromonospora endophytica]PZF96689.1 ABC transporter [Micromonospora endophytica]RIW42540.1 ABC transporter permease [Micromonospora endophytica]BCJ57463.1 transport permease protein [Micromonospora endophytica]